MFDILFDLFDLVLLFQIKRKWEIPKEWSGTVEKKRADISPTLSRYRYIVVFRTEEGKRKKLRMGKADFDLYQEGRRYTKKAGEYLPDPNSAI